jgi:AraC-like DNA-binding protein
MYYQEHCPDIRLSPFIKTYWSARGFTENGTPKKVFPDGCVEIIFTFDSAMGNLHPDILGTMTTLFKLKYSDPIQMFGIRFKPAGITAFTRVPVDELTNRSVELSLVETLFDKPFYELLPEKKSVEEIIIHIDNYLLQRLPYLHNIEKQIIHAVNLIYLANGQLSLTQTAAEVCLCPRHFERKFKSAIGISPKTFARVIRFKHALHCLEGDPHKDLLTIAVECGYYDHAHLIKDFKTFSGNTPAYFKR